MIDVDPLTSRLLAAIKQYPPISKLSTGEREQFILRVISVGVDRALPGDHRLIERARRNRRRDLKKRGATYDQVEHKPI